MGGGGGLRWRPLGRSSLSSGRRTHLISHAGSASVPRRPDPGLGDRWRLDLVRVRTDRGVDFDIVNRRIFRAMGCDVIIVGGEPQAFEKIAKLFEERDATFSRFRSDSELTRVNATRGSAVVVSPVFLAAVSAALGAASTTRGLVDPTLGAAIVAAGYDRDFDDLVPIPRAVERAPRADWRQIRVGPGVLFRPPGTVFDLNGVVKSMTVDTAASLLGAPGFVAAGGDLATHRSPVTVALPSGGAVTLESGGIATSGTATRRWLRGGSLYHHLIDPHTGLPSSSPWTYVTAVGRNCLSADIAAKAGFLLGEDGPGWLDTHSVAARFVADGRVVENACWTSSLVREQAWA